MRAVLLFASVLGVACAKTQPPPAAPSPPPPSPSPMALAAPVEVVSAGPAAAPAPAPPVAAVSPDIEARLAKIEKMLAEREEALKFLDMAYEQQVEQQTKPQPGVVYGVDIEQNLRLGQVAGPPTALVTIVEAWDFACPHCYRASMVLKELLDEYKGQLRVVFKNMVVHPQQVAGAHRIGCAAAKQGKFKEFYWAFFEKGYKEYQDQRDPTFLSEEHAYKVARDLAVNMSRLKADVPGCSAVIEADEAELRKFRVSGTPAFFINGEFIGGGIPKEAFKQYIDQKLELAKQSKVPAARYYEQEIRGKGEKEVKAPERRGR